MNGKNKRWREIRWEERQRERLQHIQKKKGIRKMSDGRQSAPAGAKGSGRVEFLAMRLTRDKEYEIRGILRLMHKMKDRWEMVGSEREAVFLMKAPVYAAVCAEATGQMILFPKNTATIFSVPMESFMPGEMAGIADVALIGKKALRAAKHNEEKPCWMLGKIMEETGKEENGAIPLLVGSEKLREHYKME